MIREFLDQPIRYHITVALLLGSAIFQLCALVWLLTL